MHHHSRSHNKTKSKQIGINPTLWGPLMWNLLHELAKDGNRLSSFSSEYNNIIKAMPYILPCETCRNHCSSAYNTNKIAKSISSPIKFKDWVWKMKSIANQNTNAVNLSFENYVVRLNARSSFISEPDLWDLLFMISYSYPASNDNGEDRQKYYVLFFNSVINLCEHFEHLSMFALLKSVFGNKFDNYNVIHHHLSEHYKSIYGKHPDVKKYV